MPLYLGLHQQRKKKFVRIIEMIMGFKNERLFGNGNRSVEVEQHTMN